MRQQERRHREDDPVEKAEAPGPVGMSRDEVQVELRDLPEQALPDDKPVVPAERDELGDRDADEQVPVAGRRDRQSSRRHQGAPAVGAEPGRLAPDEPAAARTTAIRPSSIAAEFLGRRTDANRRTWTSKS